MWMLLLYTEIFNKKRQIKNSRWHNFHFCPFLAPPHNPMKFTGGSFLSKIATANNCKHSRNLRVLRAFIFRHLWHLWHSLCPPDSLSFIFLLWRCPEEEGGLCAAAVAQSLRHQHVQHIDQQEDRLAVHRYSV